ncbi:ABC transporter substrate-binding protein [Rhodopila sp.]|uniref:ABC transporter substrate-binding protein n=1 Tax=Rhodopila sp. TaxID=2480087 RepID=UPI003D1102CA
MKRRSSHASVRIGIPAMAALLALSSGSAVAAPATQGVTATEIVAGSTADLSGVTAVQGVNNSNAVRMVFDDANAQGGVNGRKIRLIVEDMQYQVPHAVQAINKLLNLDHVFFTVVDGGTPMNNAEMPMQFQKNVPNLFPLTAARSMYEPYNRLKFAQFASYYDQMRSGVKYFVEQRHVSHLCAMYQDTDFGRDVLQGVQAEAKALGMQVVATTAHQPTDTNFSADLTKLRDAGCDWVGVGTIVRDSIDIVSQAKKMGWTVPFVGQSASYDTAIATAPGDVGEGFYSMSPSIYAYADDPRPAVREFFAEYKKRFGIDPNFLGETGYSAAHMVLLGLQNAGQDLTVDSLIKGLESIHSYTDIFGTTYSFGPNQHHGETSSYLSVVHKGRWVPVQTEALGY